MDFITDDDYVPRNEILEDFSPRPADELARTYPVVWGAVEKLFPELPEERRAVIASLVTQVCSDCHEDCRPCWCNYHTPRNE